MPLRADAQLDPSSPWPKWAHDNRNSGIGVKSQASGYTQNRVRWIFGTAANGHSHWLPGETVESGIVVGSDNLVFVPTSAGRVLCLSGSNGTHRWTFNTLQGERVGSPAIVLVASAGIDSPGGDLDGAGQYRIESYSGAGTRCSP